MICVSHCWNTALNKPPDKYYKFLRELFVTFTDNKKYILSLYRSVQLLLQTILYRKLMCIVVGLPGMTDQLNKEIPIVVRLIVRDS